MGAVHDVIPATHLRHPLHHTHVIPAKAGISCPASDDVFMGIHAATINRTEPILYPR